MPEHALDWNTLSPTPPAREIADDASIHHTLSACSRLDRLVQGSVSDSTPILIIVNDPQRSTRTRSALNGLAQWLRERDLRPEFRVLVATGTHRFSESRREEFVRSIFDNCGLNVLMPEWHDAKDDSRLVMLNGLRIHRRLAECRYILPIGSVEPHYFAGFTGPHKTVTIGCLAYEDIERNHAAALDPESDILKLTGNPIHTGVVDMLARLKTAGKRICAIGQVVLDDRVCACAAGEPLEVLQALRPMAQRVYLRSIDRTADILHLRVPPPLGRSLYQADKALKNNHRAVHDDGGIILEATCEDGIGQDAFCDILRSTRNHAEALSLVRERGYRLGDHKAVKLRHLLDPARRNVRLALVAPGLPNRELADMNLEALPTPEEALSSLIHRLTGPIRRGLIIEDAAMVTVTSKAGTSDA
ncbi:MAG: lactate racemase domain-containing protein [Phycisphaerae bacterium]